MVVYKLSEMVHKKYFEFLMDKAAKANAKECNPLSVIQDGMELQLYLPIQNKCKVFNINYIKHLIE